MSAERGVPLTYVEAGIFAFGIDGATTHIAFRRAEAAALVDVAEAARASRLPGAHVEKFIALQDALDRLDEARR